jgi:hypothetical protein
MRWELAAVCERPVGQLSVANQNILEAALFHNQFPGINSYLKERI